MVTSVSDNSVDPVDLTLQNFSMVLQKYRVFLFFFPPPKNTWPPDVEKENKLLCNSSVQQFALYPLQCTNIYCRLPTIVLLLH